MTFFPGPGSLRAATAAFLLVGAAACQPVGESAPTAGACRSDRDCPAGGGCSAGACVPLGGGAGSGGTDECASSDDCWASEPGLVPDVYTDGNNPGDPVCTVPPLVCPGPDVCPTATGCLPPPDGATRPGSFACEQDDQCLSGRCLPLVDGGICARTCYDDGDCAYVTREDGTLAGFSCGEVDDEGIPIRSCLPADPAHPEATLCRRACDCVAGACDPAAPGPLSCRFDGVTHGQLRAVPVCSAPPGGGGLPTLFPCPSDPASCAGGSCNLACDSGLGDQGDHFCSQVPERCTQPCSRDTDCPQRTVCVTGEDQQRVGRWLLSFQRDFFAGREIRLCLPPPPACYDEVDCCPEPDGAGGCLLGWTVDRTRCSVEVLDRGADVRLITVCKAPDGRAAPGACCSAHADCDSRLCVPARPGTACAGGGVCSVPCDPFPDPDGLPGSGDERDRCADGDFASDYHQASRCLPFSYEIEATAGARVVELSACQ